MLSFVRCLLRHLCILTPAVPAPLPTASKRAIFYIFSRRSLRKRRRNCNLNQWMRRERPPKFHFSARKRILKCVVDLLKIRIYIFRIWVSCRQTNPFWGFLSAAPFLIYHSAAYTSYSYYVLRLRPYRLTAKEKAKKKIEKGLSSHFVSPIVSIFERPLR